MTAERSGRTRRSRTGRPLRKARPPLTAVLLATAPATGGGPAALLSLGERDGPRAAGRPARGPRRRDDDRAHPPRWEADVRQIAAGADVRASDSLADDLARSARSPRSGPAARRSCTATSSRTARRSPACSPTRASSTGDPRGRQGRRMASASQARRGRMVSAASPYHAVGRANGTFLGVLKVAAAELARSPRPPSASPRCVAAPPAVLEEELERKSRAWRAHARPLGGRPRTRRTRRRPTTTRGRTTWATSRSTRPSRRTPSSYSPAADEAWLHDPGRGRARGRRRAAAGRPRPLAARTSAAAAARAVLDAAAVARRRGGGRGARSPRATRTALLLDSAVKATDGFFTTFFVSPYSKYIARWAARRGLTRTRSRPSRWLIGVAGGRRRSPPASAGAWSPGAVLLQAGVHHRLRRRPARPLHAHSSPSSARGWTRSSTAPRSTWRSPAWRSARAAPATRCGCSPAARSRCRRCATCPTSRTAAAAAGARHRSAARRSSRRATRVERAAARAPRGAEPASARAAAGPPLASRVLGAWRRIDRVRPMRWVKRMIAFPIGERFAVISITAALFNPRVTFIVAARLGRRRVSPTPRPAGC